MIFFALISAFTFISKEKPVAIVANQKVFENDIPDNLTLEQYLQNIVFFKLAKEKGYDDSVKTRIDEIFDQEIIRRTITPFIQKASEPTPYECALYYRNSGKKVSVQIIQTDNLKDAIKAYLEVLQGEDFGEMSQKYSFHPAIKNSKGVIDRPIQWSFVLPNPLQKLFNMKKNEISLPIKYEGTWNIIKIINIEDQNDKNVIDRKKMTEEISSQDFQIGVSKNKTTIYSNKIKIFIPWLANVKTNSKNISSLCKKISELKDKSTSSGLVFEEEELNLTLATSAVGEYKLADFLEDAGNEEGILAFSNEAATIGFIEQRIFNQLFKAACKRLGAQREPFLAENYKKNIKNATLDFFKRKEILSIIKETENELIDFYQNNKDKYNIKERRRVSLIEVSEINEINEIINRLSGGEKFQALVSEKSIGRGNKKTGDVGYIEKTQMEDIGQIAFGLQKGEISEPFETKIGWAIIKVTDIKKSYQPDFKDVKSSVRNDYKLHKAKEIGDKIYQQNREKYKVKILT